MTVQPRKQAPDLSQFFDEPQGSKKAKLREAKKVVRQAKKCVGPKPIVPRNEIQAEYLDALETFDQIFAVGPAGCGKSWIAATWGAKQVAEGNADKIILCRPMAMAREDEIGHLPGDIGEKFAPWAQPIIEAIDGAVGKAECQRWLTDGKIQFWLTAHLQGRTMSDAIVIFDEAQNATVSQMMNFLTRAGENCTIIVDGDLAQKRIKGESGLARAIDMLDEYEIDAAVVEFSSDDVVRSGLCKQWVQAIEAEGLGSELG